MSGVTVAAFDFDETLTTRDTVVPFLRRVAGTPRFVAGLARRGHRVVPAMARGDRDHLRAIATEVVFTGLSTASLHAYAAGHGRVIIEQHLRDDTVARLRWHVAEGHHVVIVSASYEQYLHVVAAHLGADAGEVGVVGTRLVVDAHERFTGELDGANCRGPEKVHRLTRWLDEQGHTRANVTLWAYGDSRGDRELLAHADHPIWVNERLASVAPTR